MCFSPVSSKYDTCANIEEGRQGRKKIMYTGLDQFCLRKQQLQEKQSSSQ